jgi:integrase
MKTPKVSKIKVRLKKGRRREVFWKVTTPKKGGGRIRRFFKEEKDADIYIEQQENQLGNYGMAGANLPEKLRMAAIVADEILAPLGLDLVDAAKHYAKHVATLKGGMPLADAIAKVLESKSSDEFSPNYQKSLAHRLGHFAQAFPDRKTTDISKDDLRVYLASIKSPETRKSYHRNIKLLYRFLVEYHGHKIDPVPKLSLATTAKETKWSVETLTPEECSALLAAAPPSVTPSLVIGMFCGLRDSEIDRLDWKNIELDEKRIPVNEAIARKVGSKRTIPIPDCAMEWLQPLEKSSGKIRPENYHELFEDVRIAAGFRPSNTRTHQRLVKKGFDLKPWPSNCLRHSAISYALASCGDENRVSTWAGNSPAMIKKHYDGQVKATAAERFFSLTPRGIGKGKIRRFKAA